MDLVGYKLINQNGDIIEQWGGTWGQCPGVPNPLRLPSDLAQVHCAEVDVDYQDFDEKTYRLVRWEMDPPAPVAEKTAAQKLVDFLAANPDVQQLVDGGSA